MIIRLMWTIVLFCCSSVMWAFDVTLCQTHPCMMVVDAGSTGSRVHLYQYEIDEQGYASDIRELWSHRVTPGLANVPRHAAAIDTYLTQLFSLNALSNVPVFFYATAGMRLLPEKDQAAVYGHVSTWLKKHAWKVAAVKTIQGQDEAIFAWFATVHRLGLMDAASPAIGVMDMGGASVQIVFPWQGPEPKGNPNLVHVTWHGHAMTLFAHTELGLGKTPVLHYFGQDPSCFPIDYVLPNAVKAHGDASECGDALTRFIRTQFPHLDDVRTSLLAHAPDAWYTMGGLVYLTQQAVFALHDEEFSLSALYARAATDVCAGSWLTLHATYPDDDLLSTACLSTVYYSSLITAGYGLDTQLLIHQFTINDAIDWTLGVVLHRMSNTFLR